MDPETGMNCAGHLVQTAYLRRKLANLGKVE